MILSGLDGQRDADNDLSKDSQLRGRARFQRLGFHAPGQLLDLPAVVAIPREEPPKYGLSTVTGNLSYVTLLYPITTLLDTVRRYS